MHILKANIIINNDWVKDVNEEYALAEDAEDPLEPFYTTSEKDIKSRQALIKMLKQDKERVLKGRDFYEDEQESEPEQDKDDDKDKEIRLASDEEEEGITYDTQLSNILDQIDKLKETYDDEFPKIEDMDEEEDYIDRYNNCVDNIQEVVTEIEPKEDE
jgi:hypothetical protein